MSARFTTKLHVGLHALCCFFLLQKWYHVGLDEDAIVDRYYTCNVISKSRHCLNALKIFKINIEGFLAASFCVQTV